MTITFKATDGTKVFIKAKPMTLAEKLKIVRLMVLNKDITIEGMHNGSNK